MSINTTKTNKRQTRERSERKKNPTVLPDRPGVRSDAEAVEAAFEPGHARKQRGYAGRKPSRKRLEEYTYMRKHELFRDAEREAKVPRGGLPEARYDELAGQALQEVTSPPKMTLFDEEVAEQWARTSCYEDEPDDVSECVVMAAVLMLKHLHWLLLRLACRTGKRGPSPARKLVATTVLAMAFRRGRPEIEKVRKDFRGSNALLNWAYRVPRNGEKPPNRVDFFRAVHTALHPDNLDPRIVEHLQVETYRQWAQQTVLDKKGKAQLKHPMAARALICDGSFAEGQASQAPIRDEEQRLIRICHRPDRGGIQFVTYGKDGYYTRGVVGYKLVSLICPVGGRPVITALVPANTHEPDAVIYLLERLFELWPECPVEYLVGDGLFGHSKVFLRELLFRFGIDPVFPWRADYPTDVGMKGVPVCHCTGTPRPMRLLQRKGKWWGCKQRLAGNLPRGEWAPAKDKRLRYEYCCPNADARGKNGTCPNQTTYPWDDPRIHTYLPHDAIRVPGKPEYARRYDTRCVLLTRRSVVESFFSSLQRHGKQGRGVERPEWANDIEVSWMLGLGALFLTARRLVFENGLYDRAREEAEALHLLDDCTRQELAPGPTEAELCAADESRASELGSISPPDSWIEACGNDIEPLTGSAEQWATECGVELAAHPDAALAATAIGELTPDEDA